MKILVTGGAGYIGSVLVPLLLKKGHEVTVIDNFIYNDSSLAGCCNLPGFNVIKGDVRDQSAFSQELASADVVIPLAAVVGAPACKARPTDSESINLGSTLALFDTVSPSQLIIMPTTNSAYGSGDDNNYCDENSPLNPISQYAREKVAVEKALMERENSVSFRLATVFGVSPRMRNDLLVNDFVYRAVVDGFVVLYEPHFKHNYIHVFDVARAFCHAIEKAPSMTGEVFNVGLSSANISKLELCDKIKKTTPNFIYPIEETQKDPDQRNYIVSNDKIEKTGFKPKVSLEAGIEELKKGFVMMQGKKYTNLI